MFDDNNPTAITEPKTDLSSKDMELVQKFADEGLPGIAIVDNTKMARILDLYLSGKTYRQISHIISIPKVIVLYLSNKFNWFKIRNDYLADLEESMRSRVIESNIVNQDFLLQLQQFFQKKIGSNITKYLATDNVDFANAIDLKEVDKYLKTVEALQKLTSERNPSGKAPAVGLNLGETGVTVTKTGENSVDITPKSKAIGDALKQFADFRRIEENKHKK